MALQTVLLLNVTLYSEGDMLACCATSSHWFEEFGNR